MSYVQAGSCFGAVHRALDPNQDPTMWNFNMGLMALTQALEAGERQAERDRAELKRLVTQVGQLVESLALGR